MRLIRIRTASLRIRLKRQVMPGTKTQDLLPAYTPWLNRGFSRFLHRYFAKNFTAVRVVKGSVPEISGPFLACSNHPAWWDPITLLLIAHRYFPDRRCYGPIDAAALDRYPLLGRLGLLPLDGQSATSIRRFLKMSDAVVKQGNAMGLTVQGEFVDVRARPLKLEPGIGYLMRRHPEVPVIPVALEYPFWNEKNPEALIHFGNPISGSQSRRSLSTGQLTNRVADRLTETLDELAAVSQSRDPGRFDSIIAGSSGVGGSYDLLRRARAWIKGESFDAAHDGVQARDKPQ